LALRFQGLLGASNTRMEPYGGIRRCLPRRLFLAATQANEDVCSFYHGRTCPLAAYGHDRDGIEDHGTFGEMTLGQLLLDVFLTADQPIQGGVHAIERGLGNADGGIGGRSQ
jgi:hypothetical protein